MKRAYDAVALPAPAAFAAYVPDTLLMFLLVNICV